MVQPLRRTTWQFFKIRLKVYLSCDPAVPLLHICLIELETSTHKAGTHRNVHSSFFTEESL